MTNFGPSGGSRTPWSPSLLHLCIQLLKTLLHRWIFCQIKVRGVGKNKKIALFGETFSPKSANFDIFYPIFFQNIIDIKTKKIYMEDQSNKGHICKSLGRSRYPTDCWGFYLGRLLTSSRVQCRLCLFWNFFVELLHLGSYRILSSQWDSDSDLVWG